MKQLFLISLATVFLSFFLALSVIALSPTRSKEPEASEPDFSESSPAPSAMPSETAVTETAFSACDRDIQITLQTDEGQENINLHDYLVGVVAAEMPVSFETEALRAQAIAARTYTLYRRDCSPSPNHPEADVCNNVNCCKAYLSPTDLQQRWGDKYASYLAIMESAVSDTDGIAVFYENEPILAAFHSSSGSMTEDVKNVWGTELPYLVSVSTPETEAEVTRFFDSVSMTWQEFTEAIWSECQSQDPIPLCDGTLLQVEYTPSGRIQTLSIGNTSVSGTTLRSLFSLRSAAIDIAAEGDTVTLTTTGYGHGVGLSQYGANCLAEEGKTCTEILQWYYTGVTVGSVQSYLDSLA